jgi:intracellular sulfur oxidation DsrE/DsrF family protein
MSGSQRFQDTVLLITNNGIGHANVELQHKLLDTYLRLLVENNDLPAAICFYTEGVKLVVKGSSFIDRLQAIEARGVRLIICSTCLNYFNLTDAAVGIVGSMADIMEAQARAGKVITL